MLINNTKVELLEAYVYFRFQVRDSRLGLIFVKSGVRLLLRVEVSGVWGYGLGT